MLKTKERKKLNNYLVKTIKKINKEIEKDKFLLGRVVVQIVIKTDSLIENEEAVTYIFEIVDKETMKRHFFSYCLIYNATKTLKQDKEKLNQDLRKILNEKIFQTWTKNPKKK